MLNMLVNKSSCSLSTNNTATLQYSTV